MNIETKNVVTIKPDIAAIVENPIKAINYINEKLGISALDHPAAFSASLDLIETIRLNPVGTEIYEKILEYGTTSFFATGKNKNLKENEDPIDMFHSKIGNKDQLYRFLTSHLC